MKPLSRSLIFLGLTLVLTPGVSLGGKMEDNQMKRIQTVFTTLRADNSEILDDFYAHDTHFEDPLGVHKGRESVKKYYENLYKNVTEISFDYLDTISDKNKHVLIWKMNLKASGLNSGALVVVHGNSVIKFNKQDLVSYHRDYFDMGEFIYERISVLGWIIGKIKEKLR